MATHGQRGLAGLDLAPQDRTAGPTGLLGQRQPQARLGEISACRKGRRGPHRRAFLATLLVISIAISGQPLGWRDGCLSAAADRLATAYSPQLERVQRDCRQIRPETSVAPPETRFVSGRNSASVWNRPWPSLRNGDREEKRLPADAGSAGKRIPSQRLRVDEERVVPVQDLDSSSQKGVAGSPKWAKAKPWIQPTAIDHFCECRLNSLGLKSCLFLLNELAPACALCNHPRTAI